MGGVEPDGEVDNYGARLRRQAVCLKNRPCQGARLKAAWCWSD